MKLHEMKSIVGHTKASAHVMGRSAAQLRKRELEAHLKRMATCRHLGIAIPRDLEMRFEAEVMGIKRALREAA